MGVTVDRVGHQREVLKRYVDRNLLGFPVELIDSVVREVEDGEESLTIPNVPGLVAAACVARALLPQKLCGLELKAMRKSLELTGKALAAKLDVRDETLSRWENEKEPVGPASEKLFRLHVVAHFKDRIGFKVDEKVILEMQIQPVRLSDDEPQISLVLERRSKAREGGNADPDKYNLAKAA